MGAITDIQIIESNYTSSSVDENLKLEGDTGAGDNSIYLGQFKNVDEKQSYESFLGVSIGNSICVTVFKQDLINYLDDAKNEFLSPTIQKYKQDISLLYPALEQKIQGITNDSISIVLGTSVRTKKSGADQVWVFKNPGDKNFEFLYSICLPKLTQLRFYKESSSKKLYLKPLFNDKLNIDKKSLAYFPLPTKTIKIPLQRILYGAPGTGKSYSIRKEIAEHKNVSVETIDMEADYIFRTTFHPDYDYTQFVGCYKPTKEGDKITYSFTPQVFTNALVKAYETSNVPVYLVIEEINRGNCAQIFGDIFQLLDRNSETGVSEYSINVDEDLKNYLKGLNIDGLISEDGKIKLPANFNIIATMNTSDQSLFPMDSAFKRRWDWEYVPVDYENEKSGKFTITIGNKTYNWHTFLEAVNKKIKQVTKSEDKQMGNFFIKGSVDEKEFCNKVMFYLWNDISKDYYESNDSLFQAKTDDGTKHFSFNELFDDKERTKLLEGFMGFIRYKDFSPAEAKKENTAETSDESQVEDKNN